MTLLEWVVKGFHQFPMRTNKSMTLETMSILKGAQRSCQKQNICVDGELDTNQLDYLSDRTLSLIITSVKQIHQRTCIIPNGPCSVRVPIQPGRPWKMKKNDWNTPRKNLGTGKINEFCFYNKNTGKMVWNLEKLGGQQQPHCTI